MDGQLRGESRADLSGADGRRRPIMGRRQPLRGYVNDCKNWFLTLEVDPSKGEALVLMRGLSCAPRLQDLGKRVSTSDLVKPDGLDIKGVRINRAEKNRFVLFNTPFSVLFNRAFEK